MASILSKQGYARPGTYRPDFSQCVTISLQTFAVLVGLSITDFLDETKNRLPPTLHIPLFIALISLEFRYIFGSAMHLNYVYVKCGEVTGLYPKVVLLFLKDMAFLVLFGWLAVRIAHSASFRGFLGCSAGFLLAGLAWSVWDACWQAPSMRSARGSSIWKTWAVLDGGQIILTLAIMCLLHYCPNLDFFLACCLFTVNAVFLLFDFRSLQAVFGQEIPNSKS